MQKGENPTIFMESLLCGLIYMRALLKLFSLIIWLLASFLWGLTYTSSWKHFEMHAKQVTLTFLWIIFCMDWYTWVLLKCNFFYNKTPSSSKAVTRTSSWNGPETEIHEWGETLPFLHNHFAWIDVFEFLKTWLSLNTFRPLTYAVTHFLETALKM